MTAFENSTKYWQERYADGGNSGRGSSGKVAEFKATFINRFIHHHNVDCVIDHGCGDGSQLELLKCPQYLGFDVSVDAIAHCAELFAGDVTKSFATENNYHDNRATLGMSMEVIFHLVEDDMYDAYMQRLFTSATRYVIIFSSDSNKQREGQVDWVKHRKFSNWIGTHMPQWKLIQRAHPPADAGSFSAFYVYEKTRTDAPIATRIGLATHPPRKESMLQVVDALLPQCDSLCLYLNGYDEVPPELPHDEHLITRLGPGADDLGSHGKFYWCTGYIGCYLSVDDDIFYPDNYVEYMVEQLLRFKRRTFVGLHGKTLQLLPNGKRPPGQYKNHRTLHPYWQSVPRDMPVHMLGAGVTACCPAEIGLRFPEDFGVLHSGDDEDIAIFAQLNSIPMVRVVGQAAWVMPNKPASVVDALHRRELYNELAETKLRAAVTKWRTIPYHPNKYV